MRAHLVGLVIVIGAAACKKEALPPGSPSAPVSTAEQDALWKLAPRDATGGMVASPNAIAMAERYFAANEQVQAAAPELMGPFRELEDQLRAKFGTPKPTLAELGLTHDKGFALFSSDRDIDILVIPVADRDKFVAKLHGTRGETDTIEDKHCKPVGERYVCVDKPELFDKLGGAGLDAIRKTGGVRGDVEAVAHSDARSQHQNLALAAQLSPGVLTLHGALSGGDSRVLHYIGTPSRPRAGAATAAGFGVMDLAPYLADLPPLPIAPGVTFAQLGQSVAGPLTFVIPAGAADLGIRIPLNNPAPAKTVLAHCADLPPLARLGATVTDGACHVKIPQVGLDVDGWVDGNELRIGSRQEAKPIAITATPLSTELATSEWAYSIFGRGNFVGLAGAPGLATMLQSSPLGTGLVRALPMINEIGLAVRKDGDTLHFLIGIRTAWANPDDVVQKLLAITSEQLLSGKAAEIGASIASAAPDSRFAQDLKTGPGGLVAVTAPIGILAAVAIPAFMDYMKRTRKTEAELQLDKIGARAKRAFHQTGAFPKGEAPLTPAAPCCGQPNNHCAAPPAAWAQPVWRALDFSIDQPSLFQYSYQSDGKTFTAKAVGDLDCDKIMITYELRGTVENGDPTVTLTVPPPGAD